MLQSPSDAQEQLILLEGFQDVVIGASPNRLQRG